MRQFKIVGELWFQKWIALLVSIYINKVKKRIQILVSRAIDTAAIRSTKRWFLSFNL